MGWFYSHSPDRYCHESGYTSCTVAHKAPTTFGHAKIQIYIDIYNTGINYPTAIILLVMAAIKDWFCFGRIHADLTGAFGFIADKPYNLATAMVFGSNNISD